MFSSIEENNDKALVEGGVNIVERSVMAALRNERFFTLAELNEDVWAKLSEVSATPFQRREGNRQSVFEEEEQMHLRPLPSTRYENPEYKKCKVSVDYHVQAYSMRYSVPHALIGSTLDVRLTATRVDVFSSAECVATHARLWGRKGQYSTDKTHMPAKHAEYQGDWTPERFLRWASGVGPATKEAIEGVLGNKVIGEQAFVPSMNILNLAKNGRRELLEAACRKVVDSGGIPTYTRIKNTMEALRAKSDTAASATGLFNDDVAADSLGDSGCVRGPDYYKNLGGISDDDDHDNR